MANFAQYVAVRAKLEEVDTVKHLLHPHERRLVDELRANFEDPAHSEAHALHVLEVILRNVKIRENFDGSTVPREIDLVRRTH